LYFVVHKKDVIASYN